MTHARHAVPRINPRCGWETRDDGGNGGTPPDPMEEIRAAVASLTETVNTRLGGVDTALTEIRTRQDQTEQRLRRPGTPGAGEEQRGGGGAAAPERRAFENYIRFGAHMPAEEMRTMRVGDDPSAGYLAPGEFIAEVDKNIVLWSPIREYATVRGTTRGTVTLPKRIGRPTATWVEEIEDREDTDTESRYGNSTYEVKELTAYVDVSFSTLEDSAVDVFNELASDFAEEFGAAEGTTFVLGNGVKRPMGFMSDTSIPTVASGNASALTGDGLIDMYHALPSPYRRNAVWGLNSTTLGAVRKLKDTQGQYLALTANLNGEPTMTILGKPVIELPDMPDVAASAKPIVFGDFSQGYRVFDRVGFTLLRDDLTQRTKGKARFHARRRVAGGVRKSEALRILRVVAS
jgi:HK97 family phage major capsid protein